MCNVCGCGTASVEGEAANHSHGHLHADSHSHSHAHVHRHPDGTVHSHDHGQDHAHAHGHDHSHGDGDEHHHDHVHDHGEVGTHDYGAGAAGVHLPGLSQDRIVRIERDILAKNNAFASANRARLARHGVFALNLVSSPGSGKTTLLVRAIADLAGKVPVAVIEGDQQTSNDAERIRSTGVKAIQINTGKGCHLDAHMVGHALDDLPLEAGGVLFIENVGNLVCPAAFDLGEAHKVVVLSVTEGEDKPLKYPDMFAAADLMLLNKSDLLPHVEFDVASCVANALKVNPRLKTLVVSAKTGEGLSAFLAFIEAGVAMARASARAAASG
ncbi:hydrogenase nickel incorporation protein HypB [Blastochloris viridis]|uniref:Hydrogenase maturation factor HypB n=1 Tax=Blastochloris viridis TaxID=1079 RepID=A0A0H5BH69_BLAVI|nr:hydrogenase nickel incorporation protein HypB [Blastochloris viridis]ALK10300.1 Hydrogenase isoenzymes nickel incorporation protein HypB [Blastochloris viridis]BAR99766.1 [NiFe] hydrogenase nickel incorporation-associated protein HypB [Blastochloris viridis]CUU42962.1 Hydrogenase isoenzymes nickel incorporation protein hypB [Blastochloris viridis]